MSRSRRRLLAWLGIVGIAFAQVVVTAHACALRTGTLNAHVPLAAVSVDEGHCAGQHVTALPQAPQGNACEVQCTDGAPSAVAHDLPPIALVVLVLPLAPATTPAEVRELGRSFLAANSAAPPLALQFCRLLI